MMPDRFQPRYVALNLHICKGDQLKETKVLVHRPNDERVCAVRALRELYWHPAKVSAFRKMMSAACGLTNRLPHSLRAGGARALQRAGAPEWVTKVLGRWLSDCYRIYLNDDYQGVLEWSEKMG